MGPLVYMRSTASRKFKSFKGLKKKNDTFQKPHCTRLNRNNCQDWCCLYSCAVVHTLQDTLDQGCKARYSQGSGTWINKWSRQGLKRQGVWESSPNVTAWQAPSKWVPVSQPGRKAGASTSSDLWKEARNLGFAKGTSLNLSDEFKYFT